MMKFVPASIALVLCFATLARADAIWINPGAGAANALKLDNIRITAIGDGRVQFTSAGRESTRDVQQVVRIQIDDEPALSLAEEALSSGKFDVATDQYRRTLETTRKDWLRQWSAARLVQSATRANRFDAAVAGYVALIQIDPRLAGPYKPALPDAKSTYLATAINDVTAALATPGIGEAQKQVLAEFLQELQQARGDQPPAAAPAPPSAGPTPDTPGSSAATPGPAVAADAGAARVRLAATAKALDAKQFAAVIDDITANAALFAAPADQATALYYLAEARAGLAAQSNDRSAWQDAALAYMRVVAHFKHSPQAPFVARSLLKTAQITEKLNDPAAARALYQQIVDQHPTDPAAAEARAGAERLKAGP